MLVPEAPKDPENLDIAEVPVSDQPRRIRIKKTADEELPDGFKERCRIALFSEDDADREASYLVYGIEKVKTGKTNSGPYRLPDHNQQVAEWASLFAHQLTPELEHVFQFAGANHDIGKERRIWQDAMGRCPDEVVAKSFKPPRPKQLGGFRHELASVLDAEANHLLPEKYRELALHLIAAHHGGARPHFGAQAYDVTHLNDSHQLMQEQPERFGRLTSEWGPWGLAYLEALLRAADGAVSREFDTQTEVDS